MDYRNCKRLIFPVRRGVQRPLDIKINQNIALHIKWCDRDGTYFTLGHILPCQSDKPGGPLTKSQIAECGIRWDEEDMVWYSTSKPVLEALLRIKRESAAENAKPRLIRDLVITLRPFLADEGVQSWVQKVVIAINRKGLSLSLPEDCQD